MKPSFLFKSSSEFPKSKTLKSIPRKMPPRRNNHPKINKPPTTGAMADCVLPPHIMLCILTRLPVKSIHRFKSVCKPWRNVFSTPKFRKMHHAQFSQNPENQSVVIYSLTARNEHTVSLLKIHSNDNTPTKLTVPFFPFVCGVDFVGCCNGLICMDLPPLGQFITLWNPALNNMSKRVPFPELKVEVPMMVSLGLGYDDEADDFKVVRIVSQERNKNLDDDSRVVRLIAVMDLEGNKKKEKNKIKGKKRNLEVEVFSCSSDSWKTIKPDFHFNVFKTRNDTIVNGNPYWVAKVDDGNVVLVCFDVKKMEFKAVPLPSNLYLGEHVELAFVDWKGYVAILASNKKGERDLSLDVWVFNDGRKIGWTKNRRFGPIELEVDRVLQCSRNGKILVGECLEDGKVFVFNTEKKGVGVKKIEISGAEKGSFYIYGYAESLAYIKGMKTEKEYAKYDDKGVVLHIPD